MKVKVIYLDDFRLPDYTDARLTLDGVSIAVVDTESFDEGSTTSNLTVPIGITTVLYKWFPDALAAFLDLDAWFSFTWNLSIQEGEPNETRIEIGRVGNQITFGVLDKDGDNWTLMLTYNITMDGPERGRWVPNPKESMQGDEDITDPNQINQLGADFVKNLVLQKRWETGRRMRHRFFIEYAPMDVWGDGIKMNPHWLYRSLDLNECTTCKATVEADKMSFLQRCGRCGTATYCSDTCQRKDWAVHKDLCNMSMEDRGQALKITERGGLINWDPERMFAKDGCAEESKNPYFAVPQRRRSR